MAISLFSTLSLLAVLALVRTTIADTTNIVRIDPKSGLVCLILPPPGKLIGDTEDAGQVHCTDGKPDLLPTTFFNSKNFLVTEEYVQAWGYMNNEAVGLLNTDGGGQYDIHRDSGTNTAPGYPVFVELLEPDSRRWCIRFCHNLGPSCNMGKSTYGCEGALNIVDWPNPPK